MINHYEKVPRETILRAQSGDAKATEWILKRSMPIIKKLAGRYNTNCSYKDMLQEGSLAVLEALRSYDVRKERVQFIPTYTFMVIRRKLSLLRDGIRECPTYDPIGMDLEISINENGEENEEQRIIYQEVQQLVQKLSSREKFVLDQFYREGKDLDTVTRLYNHKFCGTRNYINKAQLSVIKRKILDKLRSEFKNSAR